MLPDGFDVDWGDGRHGVPRRRFRGGRSFSRSGESSQIGRSASVVQALRNRAAGSGRAQHVFAVCHVRGDRIRGGRQRERCRAAERRVSQLGRQPDGQGIAGRRKLCRTVEGRHRIRRLPGSGNAVSRVFRFDHRTEQGGNRSRRKTARTGAATPLDQAVEPAQGCDRPATRRDQANDRAALAGRRRFSLAVETLRAVGQRPVENVPARRRRGRPQRAVGRLSRRRADAGGRRLSDSQHRRPVSRRHVELCVREGVHERRNLDRLRRGNPRRPVAHRRAGRRSEHWRQRRAGPALRAIRSAP